MRFFWRFLRGMDHLDRHQGPLPVHPRRARCEPTEGEKGAERWERRLGNGRLGPTAARTRVTDADVTDMACWRRGPPFLR